MKPPWWVGLGWGLFPWGRSLRCTRGVEDPLFKAVLQRYEIFAEPFIAFIFFFF